MLSTNFYYFLNNYLMSVNQNSSYYSAIKVLVLSEDTTLCTQFLKLTDLQLSTYTHIGFLGNLLLLIASDPS